MKRAKGDRGKADALASRIVRARGACQYPGCGSTRTLQCCHIVPRRYSATRTRLDNLLCLCARHHRLIDELPDEKLKLCAQVYGAGHYLVLRETAERNGGQRFDWAAEVERLRRVDAAIGEDYR